MCDRKSELGSRHVRGGWVSQSPAPMTACLLSTGPLGCCPFPSPLCALIGHKCSCLMFGCLLSFLLLLNVTWAWSLGSEMVLMTSGIWGGVLFPLHTLISESGVFATNPNFCSPGRNWAWPDSNEEEEEFYTRQSTIRCSMSVSALWWRNCLISVLEEISSYILWITFDW